MIKKQINPTMPDLLGEFKKKDISEFHKDFSELIRVAFGIDKDYIKSHATLDDYLPRYKSLIKLFMKKYPAISLKIHKTLEEIRLRIFIKGEKNLKDIFTKSTSRIAGLKSIGIDSFDEAQVAEPELIAKALDDIEERLYISYFDPEFGTSTILLRQEKKQKGIEIIYDIKLVSDMNMPEFKLIAYYALKGGYKKNIMFYSKATVFGFHDVITELERREWLDRFNPRFHE